MSLMFSFLFKSATYPGVGCVIRLLITCYLNAPSLSGLALSQIPFISGVFPVFSLFANLDPIYERAKELGGREETIRDFS